MEAINNPIAQEQERTLKTHLGDYVYGIIEMLDERLKIIRFIENWKRPIAGK